MKKLILFLFMLSVKVEATVYYVDPATGNDSNNGTATGTPWAHVPGTVGFTGTGWPAHLNNGDKVIVKGGSVNYAEVFLANGSHDSYVGYCNGSAAFDSIIIQSGDRFSPQWGTTAAVFDGGTTNLWTFAFDTGSQGVSIDGFECRNIADGLESNLGQGSAGVEVRVGSFFTIRRCWIHDCYGHADDHGHGIEGGQLSSGCLVVQNHIGPNIGSKALETIRFTNGAITNNFFDVTKYQGDHVMTISEFCTNLDVANNFVYLGANGGPNGLNGIFQTPGNGNYGLFTVTCCDHCDFWNNLVTATAPSSKGLSGFYAYGYGVTNRFYHNTFALSGDTHNNGAGAMVAFVKQNDGNGNTSGTIWQNNLFYKGADSDGNIQWCIPYANLVVAENVQYNDFWGGVSATENVMGYRASGTGNDVLSTVAAYNPPTTGHTYNHLLQLDPVVVGGTLPTGVDTSYHPNSTYFQLSATSPISVTNTGNAVTGSSGFGWVSTSTKFVPDILGNTRTIYSMGAYEFGGTSGGPNAPAITQQPQSQTVTVGNNATFTVSASGDPTLTYQWSENGVNLAGATLTTFTKNSVTLAMSGNSYQVGVTNSVGGVLSSAAILTVQSPASSPLLIVTNGYVNKLSFGGAP